jgi:hypothetical protein
MSLPIVLFSLCFFWRDSDELKIANGTAIFAALGVLALRAQKGKIHIAGIVNYTVELIAIWFLFTADFAKLVTKDLNIKGDSTIGIRATGFVRGLIIAMPLLLLFGALFAYGDEQFAKWITNAFTFNFADVLLDVVLFAVLALFVGGFLRRLVLNSQEPTVPPVQADVRKPITLGTIELATIFFSLDILFAAFVAIQFRYFFWGTAQVHVAQGLTYAEYARSGFFELTVASALTLPVVLGFHALVPQASAKAKHVFSALSSILIACDLIVLLSAVQRMRLYIGAFGLSELRLFTTAFIIWLAVILVWLCWTVIRHRRERFAFGALVAGYAIILGLNYANPDALIAKTNLDPSKHVDAQYLSGLSLDAAPVIVANLSQIPPKEQAVLKKQLTKWSAEVNGDDWRSLNLSRIRFARLKK